MTNEPRHKDAGYTLTEAISRIANDLDSDVVGLWHIIPIGDVAFSLRGNALIDFVRRAVHALIEAGAVPVRGGRGTEYEWVRQKHYGTAKEEMVSAIIAEWLSLPDQTSSGLCSAAPWFARPDPAHPHFVKLD